jgi:hypothetical protein
MSDLRPATDRKALWVVRELALPTIVKACPACPSTRHRPTGKFRVNANHKLLDVWLLISCERCDRTSKIPVHERTTVRSLPAGHLHLFHTNDPAMVRHVLLGAAAHRLDWTGTWDLETDMPFYDLTGPAPAGLEVLVRFELPAPVRVEKLLMAGFGRSRSAVRVMLGSGRIRLPPAIGTRAREDFTFFVTNETRDPGAALPGIAEPG